MFPFTYGGVTYNECTWVEENDFWCSYDSVYNDRFGWCTLDCPWENVPDSKQTKTTAKSVNAEK